MLNIIRNIAAAALFAGVLVMCGCSEDNVSSSMTTSSVVFSDDEQSTASAFEIPTPTVNTETPYLTYLGTGEISAAALKTYSQTLGLSGTESPVTIINVSGEQYENRLGELINSDESPDLTEKRENTFPFLISRNMYEDLTSYMDVTAPQWEEYSDHIEHYSFKGAHYFYPTRINVAPELLVYDKVRCILIGSPDLEKLWENDEWTLDALTEYSNAVNASVGQVDCIVREDIAENILAMTGTSLIVRDENGKFVNRVGSENYLEMREFFLTHSCSTRMGGTFGLRQSLTSFMCADEERIGELRVTQMHLGIVPFPKLNDESPYYVRATSEGYLVPKGAKNIRNAASFINCSRMSATSSEGIKEYRRGLKKLGLLQSDVEWLETIRGGDYELVLDEGACLGNEANAAMALIFSEMDLLLSDGHIEPEYDIASIDADIERINAMI